MRRVIDNIHDGIEGYNDSNISDNKDVCSVDQRQKHHQYQYENLIILTKT